MSIIDVFGLCVRSLIKRKLRTFLTLLGVIIGTASIVLMMSLGMATQAQFAELMDSMGADMTVIQVRTAQWGRPTPGGGWAAPDDFVPELDDAAVDAFSSLPGVTVASPVIQGSVYFRSGRYVKEAWRVMGVRPAALAQMGYTLESGRFLEDGDGFAAVFGALAELYFYVPASDEMPRAWNLWGMDLDEVETLVDVLNDPIRVSYDRRLAPPIWRGWGGDDDDFEGIDADEFFRPITTFDLEVVGLLARGNEMTPWRDTQIYMDIYVLQELDWLRRESQREDEQEWGWFSPIRGERERATYDNAFVRVASIDHTHRVASAINEMGFIAEFHGEWIDMQRRQQEGIRVLLIAIAAISLLVAAINIANTMITSVTERTKEIGVMKVIGAAIKDIRRMFLFEAVMIGIMGGVFGIMLSLVGSYALNNFDIEFLDGLRPPEMGGMMGGEALVAEEVVISLITPALLLLALGVAAGVGLVAGYFPARRATKLSALAAIRSD